MRCLRLTFAVTAAALLLAGLPAAGAGDHGGRRFVVSSRPGTYAVAPVTHQMWVTAADGTRIFVETWLPAAKGKAVPPKRVPVVVDISPYALKGVPRPDRGAGGGPRWTQLLVSHGYALANVHLRGTGESGGCWIPHGRQDADDASRALDALTTAPFSDGRLALIGKSHDGGAAVNVAEHGTRQRLQGVKAMVVLSPVFSYLDFTSRDGMASPRTQADLLEMDHDTSLTSRSASTGTEDPSMPTSWASNGNKDPQALLSRTPCRLEETREVMGTDGRMTPWLRERELALDTDRIGVPVLMSYGLQEFQTRQLVGAFDRIRVPKAAVLSASWHDYPDANSVTPAYSRADWEAMVIAWLDRWVLGVRNSVSSWPIVQVQDFYGEWHAEPGYPMTGGPAGQLALGPGGTLGQTRPTGSTGYRELTSTGVSDQSFVEFRTGPLKAPLEIVGQALADLWVTVDRPVAYLQAQIVAYDAAGNELHLREGGRSVQFVAPLVKGRFVQQAPTDPPLDAPFRVVLRFDPTDMVVPAGGSLMLVFAGLTGTNIPPSTGGAQITILHDCAHPSTLRFLMPRARPDLLHVAGTRVSGQEPEHVGRLRDGAGLASAPVCGRRDARDVALQGPPRR